MCECTPREVLMKNCRFLQSESFLKSPRGHANNSAATTTAAHAALGSRNSSSSAISRSQSNSEVTEGSLGARDDNNSFGSSLSANSSANSVLHPPTAGRLSPEPRVLSQLDEHPVVQSALRRARPTHARTHSLTLKALLSRARSLRADARGAGT